MTKAKLNQTQFIAAAMADDLNTVRTAYESGVDIDFVTATGKTALMVAGPYVSEFLRENGAHAAKLPSGQYYKHCGNNNKHHWFYSDGTLMATLFDDRMIIYPRNKFFDGLYVEPNTAKISRNGIKCTAIVNGVPCNTRVDFNGFMRAFCNSKNFDGVLLTVAPNGLVQQFYTDMRGYALSWDVWTQDGRHDMYDPSGERLIMREQYRAPGVMERVEYFDVESGSRIVLDGKTMIVHRANGSRSEYPHAGFDMNGVIDCAHATHYDARGRVIARPEQNNTYVKYNYRGDTTQVSKKSWQQRGYFVNGGYFATAGEAYVHDKYAKPCFAYGNVYFDERGNKLYRDTMQHELDANGDVKISNNDKSRARGIYYRGTSVIEHRHFYNEFGWRQFPLDQHFDRRGNENTELYNALRELARKKYRDENGNPIKSDDYKKRLSKMDVLCENLKHRRR